MASTLIAPSLLAADPARLGAYIEAADEAGVDWHHVDVMDGHFVPNLSYGPAVVQALKGCTVKPLDVHLMIAPADPHLEMFAKAGAERLTIHPEAGPHLHRSLQAIRSLGCTAGVALNPATPVSAIENVLDLIDLILVMTVNPGFGGQKFIESMTAKITAARAMIEASGRDIYLQVDGGIGPETASRAVRAGADVLVAGTSLYGGGIEDIAPRLQALRGALA